MNRRKSILLAVSMVAIILIGIYAASQASIANATYWYGMTCDPSASEVLQNTVVSFAAQTSNPDIGRITFAFTNPDGQTHSVSVNIGKGACAVSTCNLDKIGTWKVTAKFEKSYMWGKSWQTIYTCPQKTIKVCYSYLLTCNCPEGKDVQIGTKVSGTAKTTDSSITSVKFTWTDPAGHKFTETKTVTKEYDHGKFKCSSAVSSSRTLNIIGNWSLKAEFISSQGGCCCQTNKVVACRYCNFNVIPEVPLLGTIGASSAMLLGFAYKMKRKPAK